MSAVLPPGAVLLTGVDVLRARDALAAAIRSGRRDGVSAPPSVVALFETLSRAADLVESSAIGTTEVPFRREVPVSGSHGQWVSVAEAAELLGCSTSYVRGLCRREAFETARTVGKGWVIERAEVLDRVLRKAS